MSAALTDEASVSEARAMHWQVLAPFAHGEALGWIPAEVRDPRLLLAVVPAHYHHDRSRPATSIRQWLDYLRHAARGWFAARRTRDAGSGIITWFPQLAVGVGLIKRLTGSRRPVIAWCFNLGQVYEGRKGRLARFALSSVDLFVVHSRQEALVYARWLDLPPQRFIFAPLSVAEPPPAPIVEEEPFVLAMGSAQRDYRTFVRVMAELGYPTVIVAGEHAVAGIALPPNVEIRRGLTIDACHNLARRAFVNVVPVGNQTTASGQVTVIEAMMLGKAVVATRCAGTEDYLEDGRTGLLVPPGNGEALKAAVLRLWEDAPLRRHMGDAALRHAGQHFTFAAAAPRMAELMLRLRDG
jgi:glycosyltransferase involved in cell wall biosynthesis